MQTTEDCVQQVFQQGFDHVGNLEALEIHASHMIQQVFRVKVILLF